MRTAVAWIFGDAAPSRASVAARSSSRPTSSSLSTFGSARAFFGEAITPLNTYVGMEYMERSVPETGIPNVVTSVLASYRGFDTLGETSVVFAAGIGVLLLLARARRPQRRGKED